MKIFKILSALLFSVIMAGTFALAGAIVGLNPEYCAIAGGLLSLVPTKEGVLGLKIGTLTTGAAAVTTIDLPYTPEYIFFTAATQLTGLKVEVFGKGVTCDLDATGLTAIGKWRMMSIGTNMYKIVLADGMLENKACKMTFTNSAAQTPDIFASADNIGEGIIVESSKATVLATTNTMFDSFAALFLPSLASGDKLTTTYEDGLNQNDDRDDLYADSCMFQYTAAYIRDNLPGHIKACWVLVATLQTAYIVRYKQ